MRVGDIEDLISRAEKAMSGAIAPYSGFKVGAALLASDGSIHTGCNIENPSLMLALCAERVALLKALSEGRTAFKAMAVVSEEGDYCFPCGACRQMLFEFAPALAVYLKSDKGIKGFRVEELLPHAFVKGSPKIHL